MTRKDMLESLGFINASRIKWLHASGICRVVVSGISYNKYVFVSENDADYSIRLELRNVNVKDARKHLEKMIEIVKLLESNKND